MWRFAPYGLLPHVVARLRSKASNGEVVLEEHGSNAVCPLSIHGCSRVLQDVCQAIVIVAVETCIRCPAGARLVFLNGPRVAFSGVEASA